MKWKKLGLLYAPTGEHAWGVSRAMLPTPFLLSNGYCRIYFTSVDSFGVGSIGYLDVEGTNPTRVISVAKEPVLGPGRAGCFDDNGVVVTSVVRRSDGCILLYYTGFELCHRIRYRLLTGVALSNDDGKTFNRLTETPILERSPSELYFRCASFVHYDAKCYRMWYIAGSDWLTIGEQTKPVYELRYLSSQDGVTWANKGQTVLQLTRPDEHGFGRPYVIFSENRYELYYSIRRKSFLAYRLGYAISADGLNWERRDEELGIDTGAPGEWDDKEICYSAVISSHGKTYMLYNGNGNGASGFGIAALVER